MTCGTAEYTEYDFARGGDVLLALRAEGENPQTYPPVINMKPIAPGETAVPAASVASVATFSATFVAAIAAVPAVGTTPAVDAVPAYWRLRLTAAQTTALTKGRYIAAGLATGPTGDVIPIDPVIINLRDSV
jgi:hypothetical protein